LLSLPPGSNSFYISNVLSSKKDTYGLLIEKCNPVIKHEPAKYIAELMGITAEWYSKLKKGQ
jgi:hypothetical protein